jgi:hypothetical protein
VRAVGRAPATHECPGDSIHPPRSRRARSGAPYPAARQAPVDSLARLHYNADMPAEGNDKARMAGRASLTVALSLMLLAMILLLLPGVGALDSEKQFIAGLHNSLYRLDLAKSQWAEEKHKSEQDVPTMADLTPYLGDWANHIEWFGTLGITYKITQTSEMESQSDIATLTRDLRFRKGICRYYPAGTRYCIHTGWSQPDSGRSSFRAFYINNQEFLATAIFMFGVGTLLVFMVRKIRSSSQASIIPHEHQNG